MAKVGKADGKGSGARAKAERAGIKRIKAERSAAAKGVKGAGLGRVARAARLPGKTSAAQKLKNAKANKAALARRGSSKSASKSQGSSGS